MLWATASMKQGDSNKDTHNQHSYGMHEIHSIAHSHEPLSKPKVGTVLIMSIYDAVHILLPLEGLRPDRREA
jgi:hypothetical protein